MLSNEKKELVVVIVPLKSSHVSLVIRILTDQDRNSSDEQLNKSNIFFRKLFVSVKRIG